MLRFLPLLLVVGCFLSRGRDDGSERRDGGSERRDGSLDASHDSTPPDALLGPDSRLDALPMDAERTDAGDEDWLPGLDPPPDTELEPGTPADLLYRYCWYSAVIVCLGLERCCGDPLRNIDLIGDGCVESAADAVCSTYRANPDAFDRRILADEELVRRELERFRRALDTCSTDVSRSKPFQGNLAEGEPCEFEGVNDHLFCRGSMVCARDVAGVRRCTPPAGLEEACEPECGWDITCSRDNVCVSLFDDGEPCGWDSDCRSRRCGMEEDGEPPVCMSRRDIDAAWCLWR